jgi:hypothetical protein
MMGTRKAAPHNDTPASRDFHTSNMLRTNRARIDVVLRVLLCSPQHLGVVALPDLDFGFLWFLTHIKTGRARNPPADSESIFCQSRARARLTRPTRTTEATGAAASQVFAAVSSLARDTEWLNGEVASFLAMVSEA